MTVSDFEATANFFNFLSFKKKKEPVYWPFYFYYSTQKYYNSITACKNRILLYIMLLELSGSFPDCAISISKFKIGECFLFMTPF